MRMIKSHDSLIFIVLVLIGQGCAVQVNAKESRSETECLWIDDARIIRSDASDMKMFEYANRGHQIGAGKRAVIAVRSFADPKLGPDLGIFFKTTFEVNKFSEELKFGHDYKVRVLDSFYAEGSSAFAVKGEYLRAVRPLQSVHISRVEDGLRLRYSQKAVGEFAATKEKRSITLKADCRLRKVGVEDLSLWQGYQGNTFESLRPPSVLPLPPAGK